MTMMAWTLHIKFCILVVGSLGCRIQTFWLFHELMDWIEVRVARLYSTLLDQWTPPFHFVVNPFGAVFVTFFQDWRPLFFVKEKNLSFLTGFQTNVIRHCGHFNYTLGDILSGSLPICWTLTLTFLVHNRWSTLWGFQQQLVGCRFKRQVRQHRKSQRWTVRMKLTRCEKSGQQAPLCNTTSPWVCFFKPKALVFTT